MIQFFPGDRVRVSASNSWAKGALGTITEPPEFLIEMCRGHGEWDGWHRFVQGRLGPIEFYYVVFDEPQNDADGDGPYKGAEIEAGKLEHV